MQEANGAVPSEWRRHWGLVAAGGVGMSLASMLHASLGIVIEPLEQEFGWPRSAVSSGLLLISVLGICLSTASGFAIDRIGARRIGIAVVLMMTGSVALMSGMSELWHWLALWLLFGIAGTATPTVWIAPISAVFDRKRGMAIGIVLCGTGISGALVPPLSNYLAETYGWRSVFITLALIWGGVTLPVVLWLFRGPGTRPKQVTVHGHGGKAENLPGYTVRQGFASLRFYHIGLAAFVSAAAVVAMIANMVPILTYTGLTRGEAAAIAGIQGLAGLGGRLAGGWIMDRWNAAHLAATAAIGAMILPLCLLLFPGVTWLAAIVVALAGMMIGIQLPSIFYLVSRHMGARSFGTFSGAISTTVSVAGGVAPVGANLIYDMTRSYEMVLYATIPALALASILFSRLGRFPDHSA